MASAKSLDSIAKIAGLPAKEEKKNVGITVVNVAVPKEVLDVILLRQGATLEEKMHFSPDKPSFIEAEIVEDSRRTQYAPKLSALRTLWGFFCFYAGEL